jgi:hypothetical protein
MLPPTKACRRSAPAGFPTIAFFCLIKTHFVHRKTLTYQFLPNLKDSWSGRKYFTVKGKIDLNKKKMFLFYFILFGKYFLNLSKKKIEFSFFIGICFLILSTLNFFITCHICFNFFICDL